jgi:hypothetical protein
MVKMTRSCMASEYSARRTIFGAKEDESISKKKTTENLDLDSGARPEVMS